MPRANSAQSKIDCHYDLLTRQGEAPQTSTGQVARASPHDHGPGYVLPFLRQPPGAQHVQRVDPAQPEGLSMATAGGLS